MVSLTQSQDPSTPSEPCVWMEAGLLAYRLCDRGFDCVHCPLDAALRGDPRAPAWQPDTGRARAASIGSFPDDRRYAEGHTWARAQNHSGVRFGLDGFAAGIVGTPVAIRRSSARRGDGVCTVVTDAGEVRVRAPVSGRVAAWNPALREHAELAIEDPYGEGWIGLIEHVDPAELARLGDGAEARRRAALDARRFRRQVALRVLAHAEAPAACLEAPWLLDVRGLIGLETLLDIVRELVH